MDGIPTAPITPHTLPNDIVTSVFRQKQTGTPYITTKFSGSAYNTFDLKSFWFGCGLTTPSGAVDTTTSCTVLVAGFRGGAEVDTASFTFTPTLPAQLIRAPMIQAVLPPSFDALDNVTIIPNIPATQALLLDDVDYYLHA